MVLQKRKLMRGRYLELAAAGRNGARCAGGSPRPGRRILTPRDGGGDPQTGNSTLVFEILTNARGILSFIVQIEDISKSKYDRKRMIMFHQEKKNIGRWASLATVAVLLTLCLLLLGSSVAVSQEGPQPRQSDVDQPEMPLHAAARFPSSVERVNPGFTVDLVQDAVWGLVDPSGTVIVERKADGAHGAAEADGTGFFWTPLWKTNGQPADIADGDQIEVHVDGALQTTIDVIGVSGGIDVLADEVSGMIDGDAGGNAVTVTVGLMEELPGEYPGKNPPQEVAVTEGDRSLCRHLWRCRSRPHQLGCRRVHQRRAHDARLPFPYRSRLCRAQSFVRAGVCRSGPACGGDPVRGQRADRALDGQHHGRATQRILRGRTARSGHGRACPGGRSG